LITLAGCGGGGGPRLGSGATSALTVAQIAAAAATISIDTRVPISWVERSSVMIDIWS
jgi:hypothetical protein